MSPDDAPIYLDYNATTPLLPEVVEAMLPYLRDHFGNPSSSHAFGRRAKAAVDEARAEVAASINAAPEEIVFTSGGTEASNLAIHGVMSGAAAAAEVVTSTIEHPATSAPCDGLEAQGRTVHRVGVNAQGRLLESEAIARITERTALVTIMHANNETGVLQPIREVAGHARAFGALVHTDAAQSLGKVEVDVDGLDVDLLTIAGHKLYAPKGVGALYVRSGTDISPFVRGAGHEGGVRPGTENVASIVGLGVASRVVSRELARAADRMSRLREALWTHLSARIAGLALNGHPVLRLPNTLNVRFPGVSGDDVLAAAPEVAASTGSACHAGGAAASLVIRAMGVPEEQARGSVRISVGRHVSMEEVERAAAVLVRAWRACRKDEGVR